MKNIVVKIILFFWATSIVAMEERKPASFCDKISEFFSLFLNSSYLDEHLLEQKCVEEVSLLEKEITRKIAAKKLQKIYRAYKVRKSFLKRELYSTYSQFLLMSNLEEVPQAAAGKTTVYLPEEHDIVLKKSGKKKARLRFWQMQVVRKILESQGSSHLYIPKARVFGDYIVEERLPINTDNFYNMSLYLNNPRAFDAVVRELTRLHTRVCLTDLVSSQYHFLSRIQYASNSSSVAERDLTVSSVRWDNFPVYIKEENSEKVAYIGLIDLEHLASLDGTKSSFFSSYVPKEPLSDLVRIFPHHLSLIMEEAEKHGLTYDKSMLEKAFKKGQAYLHIGYQEYSVWLSRHGFMQEDAFEKLTNYRFKIDATMKKKIRKYTERSNFFM